MIETVLVKKLRFPPGLTLRLIARTVYVGTLSETFHSEFCQTKCEEQNQTGLTRSMPQRVLQRSRCS
jgi:hypothetical protein